MPPEPAGSDWPGRAPGVTAGPRETSPDGSDNVHPEQITTRVRAANAERANRWGDIAPRGTVLGGGVRFCCESSAAPDRDLCAKRVSA